MKTSRLSKTTSESRFISEAISFYDNALDDEVPGARSFDDEGVPTKRMNIIEKGILKNFF